MRAAARVVVVGSGVAARARVRALTALGGSAALAGIVSRHPSAAVQAVAPSPSTPSFPDLATALADVRPDLVLLCHANAAHAPDARRALTAGCHVVVEYPLALSVGEAEDLYALADARGVSLHCGHIELRTPAHRALSRQGGDMGPLVGGSVEARIPCPAGDPSWHSDPALAGFPSFAWISRLTRLVAVAGPLAVDAAELEVAAVGPLAWADARLRAGLRTGSGASLGVALERSPRCRERRTVLDLRFERGHLWTDGSRVLRDGGEVPLPFAEGLFLSDLRDVLTHLRGGPEPEPTRAFVLEALRLAEAIRRAAGGP
ncbi:Gfo/Idh/MocA family oxidoreductase [Myxococcota bacterium]|nr:Gfo/Idh/MocA family oxidoreductase [Myxococcota bacterium]